MVRRGKLLVALATVLAIAASLSGQTKTKSAPGMSLLERRASLNLDTARGNPLQLRHFLYGMPKGADLHNHLSGAIYAESWIRAAAEDHLCVDPAAIQGTKSVFSPSEKEAAPFCTATARLPPLIFSKTKPFTMNSSTRFRCAASLLLQG